MAKCFSACSETNDPERKEKCGTALKPWAVPEEFKAHAGSRDHPFLTPVLPMCRNYDRSWRGLVFVFLCCKLTGLRCYSSLPPV